MLNAAPLPARHGSAGMLQQLAKTDARIARMRLARARISVGATKFVSDFIFERNFLPEPC
jgi:hypothetical protein